MTAMHLNRFLGLLPRVSSSLLPEYHATIAQNCDFAYGELRSTKADLFIKNLANSAASIYTDNGLTFYSWPEEVNAVRSPLASDPYDRLYYTTTSDFRVAIRSGMTSNGGVPASSYRVGVPRPTAAPVLAISATHPLSGMTLSATFHYEANGTKYQEQAIALTQVQALQKWTYTPPARNYTEPTVDEETGQASAPIPSETPASAVPVVRLIAKDPTTAAVGLDTYTANSGLRKDSLWMLDSAKTGAAGDYTITLTPDVTAADQVTRAYVFTLVNTYGEEGAPSPPAVLTINSAQRVDVQITPGAPGGDYAPTKEIRIYRTSDGGATSDYYLAGTLAVLDAPGPTFSFIDTTPAGQLNETLTSTSAYPPNPQLVGLLSLPNGVLMAWRGNELHFSDAYRPWSWPPEYVLTFGDFRIVGAVAVGAGALVTTTGKPFMVSGISPDAMTDSKIALQQAGVSKWAIADIGGMVVYASNDGLNAVLGNQPVPDFGTRYFTRPVWRERYAAGLDTMRFAVWDGRLVVYSSAKVFTPFMISLDEATGAMTELPDLQATCSFTSPLSDQCYLANGASLYQFAGGADAVATWGSREAVLPIPTNLGAAQVVCSGNWRVKFYADGVLRHTQSNLNGTVAFRLPSGFKAESWSVTIDGNGRFRSLRVGRTVRDLMQV